MHNISSQTELEVPAVSLGGQHYLSTDELELCKKDKFSDDT